VCAQNPAPLEIINAPTLHDGTQPEVEGVREAERLQNKIILFRLFSKHLLERLLSARRYLKLLKIATHLMLIT
jgi:hypothetical protein